MGLIAVLSDTSAGGVTLGSGGSFEVVFGALQSDVTLGAIAISVGLIMVLAALNLLKATDVEAHIRHSVIAASLPLLFVFILIVVDHSLQALDMTIRIGIT